MFVVILTPLYYCANGSLFKREGGVETLMPLINGKKFIKVYNSHDEVWALSAENRLYNVENSKEYVNTTLYSLTDCLGFIKNKDLNILLYPGSLILSKKSNAKNEIKPRLSWVAIQGSFKQNGIKWVSDFDDNLLEIQFIPLPNIRSAGTGKVYYSINSKNWKLLGPEDKYKLTLQRLPAGDYEIIAYVQNEDDLKSERIKINLRIKRPYYATWWFISLCIGFIVALVYILLSYRNKVKLKQQSMILENETYARKALQSELSAIRSQMNPHFIFNSLSAIQSKIVKNETQGAFNDLNMFSKLMRQALEFSTTEFITLQQELDFLNRYIKLELEKSNHSFTYQMTLANTLRLEEIKFPSLMLQPFAENAIRHGLKHSEFNRVLKVEISAAIGAVIIDIIDNGIGIEKSQELNKQVIDRHKSFAMQAIRDRISILNMDEATDVKLSIINKSPGTQVRVYFKNASTAHINI